MKLPIYAYAAVISCFLPAVAGLFSWKKTTTPIKVLTLFFCYNALDVIAEDILRRNGINNQFLGNIHQLIEIGCFLYFFGAWTANRTLKISLLYVGVIYLVFWIFNKFYFERPDPFNEIIATVANFVLIVVSVLILYELIRNATFALHRYMVFWIVSAVIVYCSGTIVIFSFSNTILQMGISYFTAFWYVNWTLTILVNLIFMASYRCKIL